MQRNQRDTQRRQDYAAFAASIANYITNNNGNLPTDCGTKTTTNDKGETTTSYSSTGICANPEKYINSSGKDQSGNAYKITVRSYDAQDAAQGVTEEMEQRANPQVFLIKGAECDTAKGQGILQKVTTSTRAYAVVGQLETGVFCQNGD